MEKNDQQVHEEFKKSGAVVKEAMRTCALMLPEIVRRGIWKKKGFSDVYQYARVFAGMGRHAVDEALRVLKRVQELPEIRKVIEQKGICAVRPVVSIATPETDRFWAEKAVEMSKNTLEIYVREIKKQHAVKNEAENFPRNISKADSFHVEVSLHLSPELAEKLFKLKGSGEWEVLLRELLEYREQVLKEKQPEQRVATSRHIPAEIERFVIERSRGMCEFPRCIRPYAILHHTQRFALDAVHDPKRLVALCIAHERMAHLGLIRYEEEAPEKWTVRDQADPTELKFMIDQKVRKFRRPG